MRKRALLTGSTTDMLEQIEKFKNDLLENRACGVVHVDLSERKNGDGDIRTCADNYVVELGFKPLGELWKEVDRSDAELILRAILHKDLAYNAELITPDDAQQLAERFLAFFSEQAKFFTNGTLGLREKTKTASAGWNPVTTATFDTGIVACDAERIGWIWIEDED